MTAFLKEQKVLKELQKGVQSMKTFVYPSVLQKQAMPPLKKANGAKNVILRYREMNGIKLTVLLPTLHNQIKSSIMAQAADPTSPPVASLVLCSSQLRASQMYDFATELTVFCNEIVEVVNIDDSQDNAIAKL